MKAPAFQWYAAEYLADERVAQLSLESEAVYVRLLSYCWREGTIPSSPVQCAPLCKYADVKVIKPALALFTKTGAASGRLVHKRLEEERAKQEAFRAKQSEKGAKGGRPRKNEESQEKAAVKPDESHGFNSVKPDESSSFSSSTSSSKSKSNDLQAPASPADLTSSLKAETPSEPRGPAEVLADEAAVFTIAGFRAFVNTIGYGKVDLGFYLPQIQYEAAKQPARPNAGPGKTWEAFVKFYLNNERKYDRLTYPAPAGGYHAGPNPALQVTTTRDDYSPAGLAARNVTRY